jgi:hypothetical protein
MHYLSTVINGSLLFKNTYAEWLDYPALLWAFKMSLWVRGRKLRSRQGHWSSRSMELIISMTCCLLKLQRVTRYPPPISKGLDSRTMKRVPDLSKQS